MSKRVIKSSLNEDMEKLGLSNFNMAESVVLSGGMELTENSDSGTNGDVSPLDDDCVNNELFDSIMAMPFDNLSTSDVGDVMEALKGKKLPEDADDSLKNRAKEVVEFLTAKMVENNDDEDSDDPLVSEDVNEDLFDAIMGLKFENLDDDDVDEILEGLKGKNLPEDADDSLKERADEVVEFLVAEAVAKKTRRSKAGSMAKKASFQCPPGTRKDPGDKSGRRCVRAAKAAGGAGKLIKMGRKKGKWSKSGKGKKSTRKSDRWAARREGTESTFAMELAGLVEDTQDETVTVRDELLNRIGSIMEMLSGEFLDEAVTRIFEESYEPIAASWDAGRLDEDVMDEDEFIAEIKPVLTLVHKSLGRFGVDGGLGN